MSWVATLNLPHQVQNQGVDISLFWMDLDALVMTTMALIVLEHAWQTSIIMRWLFLLGAVAILWSHAAILPIGCWVVGLIRTELQLLSGGELNDLYLETVVSAMIGMVHIVMLFVVQFGKISPQILKLLLI